MKLYLAILETLKDLDTHETDRLYQSMIDKADFEEATIDDDFPMFIFPDGRILGSFGYGDEDEGVARALYHNNIYDAESKYFKGTSNHPMLDIQIATYHNLIIVVPMDEEGAIIIPDNVEPTTQQLQLIKAFKNKGYTIENWDTLDDVPDHRRNRLAEKRK